MAYKSSINTSAINKSVGTFKQSLGNAQKSAARVNSSLVGRNKFKKESISRKNYLFTIRRAAVKRKESEDAAEATTALGVRKAPSKISSSSTRSFFGRMMDISGALMAGWLVGNLPNIINLAEATSRRAIEVSRVLSGAVTSFTQILTGLLAGLGTIGSSILRGDIGGISSGLSKSTEDMKNSFYRMYVQLEEAYKILKEPLDFSKDIEELKIRLGLEVPGEGAPSEPGAPGTSGTGGRLQPIHKQALDIISGPESGGDYNAMNNGQAGDRPGGSKKWLGKNLTDMTIGEVKDFQNNKKTLWAAGRYQIIPGSLPTAQKSAGLNDSDKFDQNNQDLLAIGLLKVQGPGAWSKYSRYTKQEIDIMYKAKATPLGQPAPTARVQPGTKYSVDQNITNVVGAKGTSSVIVTSLRGNRIRNGRTQWHGGIDIATDSGTYIALRANGVVMYAGNRGGYGLMVDIWVESYGIKLRMAHCSALLANCKAGATIPAGVSFARVGSTGESTGPHIHFEADTNKNGTMNGGRDYGGNTSPDPYVPLLLLTSGKSNGYKSSATVNGKPAAQISRTGTGGGPEVLEALTPERKGQTIIVAQQQAQQAQIASAPAQKTALPFIPDNSLNSLRNNILLTHLAYT